MFRFVALLTLVAVATADIVHPCAEDQRRECFANHLAKIGGCEPPASIPTVDSFKGPAVKIEMPFYRATIDRYDATIEGVSNVGDWVLFYDTEKNTTVLSYNFPSVLVYGRQEMQYHFPGEIDTIIDTAYRTVYTNVNVSVQWEGVDQVTIGVGKLYSNIDSFTSDFETDFPELAAVIAADPNGIAATNYKLSIENPTIYLRELESPVGKQIVRPFFNNWLCPNLP